MLIERDPLRMEYVIRIEREELERAFVSQNEYNTFTVKLSKLIYEYSKEKM